MAWYGYRPYVPVAQRRARAWREMEALKREGHTIEPVEIEGRTIARSFWGRSWCKHLESFADFTNRLPRGRTYARNGSVCHLAIVTGEIEARVMGSQLYRVSISIRKLEKERWQAVKAQCADGIGSMLELLRGQFSGEVMRVVSDHRAGLFPRPGEIEFHCSCPDGATLCKHVAAVLYGVGHRLDHHPELLFTLRGVDPQELVAAEVSLPAGREEAGATLAEEQLSDVFGIELDTAPPPAADAPPAEAPAKRQKKKSGKTGGRKPAAPRRAPARSRQRTARPRTPARGRTTPRQPAAKIRPTGRSVARLRRKLKCSVAEFAELLGVTPPTIYRWEATSGRLTLNTRTYNALAAAHERARRRTG